MKHFAIVAALLGAVALASAQSSTVTGRVVNDVGDPVPNARVGLAPQNQGTPVVLTDSSGRFTIDIPAGQFRVVAGKTGYAKREVAPTPGLPLEIRLVRSASISGRAVDETGEPVVEARVNAEPIGPGKVGDPIVTTTTDERGEYRLSGLAPDAVAVSITPFFTMTDGVFEFGSSLASRVPGAVSPMVIQRRDSRVYYPGVATLEAAEALRLEPGERRPAVNFVLNARQYGAQISADLSTEAAAQERRQVETLLSRLPPGAPPTVKGTAAIRGRVVSSDGRPLQSVRVTINCLTVRSAPRVVKSGSDGAFEATELPAGEHRLIAAKAGFSLMAPGATPTAGVVGPIVSLAEGEKRERVEIRLAQWRSIEGRVLDELGEPIEGASVVAYQVRYQGGGRRMVETGSRRTDDVGQYRFSGLAPGRYIVGASVGAVASADIPGYARTFFPATTSPSEAQFVTMSTSQDTTGIDIPLSRTRTARVAGRAMKANGDPMTSGLRLFTSRAASVVGTSVGAWITPDGSFEFSNVAPGQYIIQAYPGQVNGHTEGEFAAVPVAVSGSAVTDLVVQTTVGSSIAGRVTFNAYNGGPTPTGGVEVTASLVDEDASPGDVRANIRDDWTFEVRGVHGPRRLQLTRTPPGWTLDAIRVRGADVTDRVLPFGANAQSLDDVEVVLTDRVGALSIAVTDGGKPVAGAVVIVFAIDRDRRYPSSRFFGTATTGTDGTATLAGLPGGAYYAAIGEMPADGPAALRDPALLESLGPRATTVILGEADRKSIALRLPAR